MLPEDFKHRMKNILDHEYDTFMQSFNLPNIHALRINTKKASKDMLPETFTKFLSPVPWCKDGFYYEESLHPGRHPYHEAGVYYIQEPSAMAPAEYLDVKPGEFVLDLCAAPGGKSTQLAGSMRGNGILISNEINPSRAKILSENIERMGITNAIVTNESPKKLSCLFPEYFDKIMVDAPCSGEGMFRKNSDACLEWSLENVELCARRQEEILDYAASMLKPGGRFVYSTCTFSPEENEGSIANFLFRHRDFQIVKPKKYDGMSDGIVKLARTTIHDTYKNLPYTEEILSSLTHTIRLWPHKIKGEGHFVAVLEKVSNNTAKRQSPSIKGISEKSIKDYHDFCRQNLLKEPFGIPILFGNQLYLVPNNCPPLDKIKVLRPGLHLGTLLKNRFEPSHSLALSLNPEHARHTMNLTMDGEEIYRYLNGETLNCKNEKGWYLITIDGFSIGFGKLSADIMKNHYPKGLRKNLSNHSTSNQN